MNEANAIPAAFSNDEVVISHRDDGGACANVSAVTEEIRHPQDDPAAVRDEEAALLKMRIHSGEDFAMLGEKHIQDGGVNDGGDKPV